MSDPQSFRRLLKQSPESAAAIVDFNWSPASYVHPDFQRRFVPGLPEAVWHEPRVAGRVSGLLLEICGLRDKIFVDTPYTLWPVALLPADRLQRLARHIGALALGIRIRSSLSREHVLGWKQRLGEEAYRFAMNSAALLPSGRVPLSSIAADSADEIGVNIIFAALAQAPEGLRARVALKLPEAEKPAEMDADTAGRLLIKVAQVVEGEWFSSFAPIRK